MDCLNSNNVNEKIKYYRVFISNVIKCFMLYGDYTNFLIISHPCFLHGGSWLDGVITGIFTFSFTPGEAHDSGGSRLVYIRL